ncbi:hypothetical protein [Micromonospora zhanjiangensis]|uniref:Uncharacterized protein n=1 Tax=Micromonospora zhanjiangensis TaxID=1522057 RepID=A0ABV8KKP2_9ACTN
MNRTLTRGPLCLTCMGAWEMGIHERHERCKGALVRLGRVLQCRCWCWDGAGVSALVAAHGDQPAERRLSRARTTGRPQP